MSDTIIVAMIALIGNVAISGVGMLMTRNLVTYRLSELEKKVEKHNNVVERLAIAEISLKSAHHRIDELKEDL